MAVSSLLVLLDDIALVLDDVIALPEPVPCKGALGFWTVPEDVEAKCLAQIVRTP